jgi:hypothetical protein
VAHWMSVDISNLHGVLKDRSRRKILTSLKVNGSLSYSELLNLLETPHTGKLNYHLKILGDLIQKDDQLSKYKLTEKGELAVQLLSGFSTENYGNKPPQFNFSMIGKILIIVGGVLYLVGALPWITYGVTIFSYVLAVLVSAVLMIVLGALIQFKSSRWNTLKIVGALVLSFIGFSSFKIDLRFNFGSGYFINPDPTSLALWDPIVLGFAISLIGLFLILGMSRSYPKFSS